VRHGTLLCPVRWAAVGTYTYWSDDVIEFGCAVTVTASAAAAVLPATARERAATHHFDATPW
jgi:hypothetical protein